MKTSEKAKKQDWFKKESSGNSVPVRRSAVNNLPSPVSYFAPLSNFFSDIDQIFDNAFQNFGFPALAFPGRWNMPIMFRPAVDIASNEETYTITAEVPGMDEKDIHLNVSEDGLLTISGEKRLEDTENRKNVVCTECSYGAFQRSISLPEDVDQGNIEARFRNGILTIICPRKETLKSHSRQIPIGSRRGSPEGSRAQNERAAQGHKQAA